jgi:hypothetical protein
LAVLEELLLLEDFCCGVETALSRRVAAGLLSMVGTLLLRGVAVAVAEGDADARGDAAAMVVRERRAEVSRRWRSQRREVRHDRIGR